VKAVFFDAGGTLIHIDYPRIGSAIRQVLGREVPPEAWVAADYAGRDAVEAAMASGEAQSDGSRWRVHFSAMLAAIGLSSDDFARVTPVVMESHRHMHLWCAVQPGTAEALAALKEAGWFVAVISNADGTVEKLLTGAGLTPHLRFIVDSGLVGVEKPNREIFDLALEKAGVSAAESYYVGDLFPVDVVGARNAGLTPVLLDPLGRYGRREVRTAPDVPSFVRELVSAREAA
jgi:putative hydrolase of the HAD superfamily